MGQFSVGEDLFTTLIIVGLFGAFIATFAYSHHVYMERMSIRESFDSAMDVAEDLKNRVLAISPGLIVWTPEKLEDYSRLLFRQGKGLRVEIRSLDGKVLYSYGQSPKKYSSPASVSLPVAITRDHGSAQLCEFVVWIWRL